MGQLFFEDENGHTWMCGFDNPGRGFFAQRRNPEPPPPKCENCPDPDQGRDCDNCPLDRYEPFDIIVGFGFGVPDLDQLVEILAGFDFKMTPRQKVQMKMDRHNTEGPLYPMQRQVEEIFKGLGLTGENVGYVSDLRRKDA